MNTTTTIDLLTQAAKICEDQADRTSVMGAVMQLKECAAKIRAIPVNAAREGQQEPVATVNDRYSRGGYNDEIDVLMPVGTKLYAAPVAQQSEAVAVELQGVAEELAEDSGFWESCSGCYETEDGHAVGHYPYSHIFKCVLGSGCRECGGLGAVWDSTDYAEMARDWTASERDSPQPTEAGAPTAAADGLIEALRNIRDYRTDVTPEVAEKAMRFYAELALSDISTSGRESAAPAAPTDLSKRLREFVDQNLTPYPRDILAAADEIDRLASHPSREGVGEQDAKDAARYRFLREHWVSFSAAPPLSSLHWKRGRLDAAVDAAMQKGAQTHG